MYAVVRFLITISLAVSIFKCFCMTEADTVPTMETERCFLREMRPDDAVELFPLCSDEDVARYFVPLSSLHKTIGETRVFIEERLRNKEGTKKMLSWVIIDKVSGSLIGLAYLYDYIQPERKAGFGSAILPTFWGRGIVPEVARAIGSFAFKSLQLIRLEATCDPRNAASRRVMEKCGMRFEGLLRKYHIVHGEPCDREIYSITDDEFARTDDTIKLLATPEAAASRSVLPLPSSIFPERTHSTESDLSTDNDDPRHSQSSVESRESTRSREPFSPHTP